MTTLAVILWAFAYFISKPRERLPEPPPIEAQLIEIPTPVINAPPEEKRAEPSPVKPVLHAKPRTIPLVATPKPSIEKKTPQNLEETPSVAPNNTEPGLPEPQTAPVPNLEETPSGAANDTGSALPEPQTPSIQAPSGTGGNLTGTSGAQAIARPMPQIPDDLRYEAISASALARFHVAADGTATVELVKPTPNPRLNRLLLDTLKNWRFFPAMKDGKPVASTQEIVIKVDVK